MAAAESSADDLLPSSPPITTDRTAALRDHDPPKHQRNTLPGQFHESDEEADESQQFWDVRTTAHRSPSSSPPSGVHPIAATGRSTSRHIRDASFTTAVEFGASTASRHQPPTLELTSPTPLPTRLQTERQRWLLSRSQSGESAASERDRTSSPATENPPTLKRNPASFSSNGTATDDGPPPALLNQRSKSRDARRSPTSRSFLQRGLQPLKLLAARSSRKGQDTGSTTAPQDPSAQSQVGAEQPREDQDETLLSPTSQALTSPMDGRPRSSRRHMQDMNDYAHGIGRARGDDMQAQDQMESSTEGQSGEDVFLNLAQDSPYKVSDPTPDKLERRKSRLTRPSQRQSLPASQNLDRTDSSDRDSTYGPPSAYENNRMYSRRPSQVATTGLGSYREASPASSTGRIEALSRLDQYRQRYVPSQRAQSVVNGPKSPDMSNYARRRPSMTSDLPSPGVRGQTYRPSRLNNTLQDPDSSSAIETPPQATRNRALSMTNGEGNESVISGPSAMWDELEELKLRIKRMERNGAPGSASGAAVQSSTSGSNERPRTATTTVTTISSSPKHSKNQRKALSPPLPAAAEEGEGVQSVHPLLHQALARCKTVLLPPVYRVLEATATEAVEMAAMTGSVGPQGSTYAAASIINGVTVGDRQVRRKADNMCRTITELCIALCETPPASSRPGTSTNNPAVVQSVEQRPSSKSGPAAPVDAYEDSPASGAYVRHAMRSTSLEPEGANGEARSSPSRALSRIEARRTSLNVTGLSNSASNSPRELRLTEADDPLEEDGTDQQPRISSIPNRFNRAGTSLLRSRRRVGDDEANDDPTIRPMSRALTDIGGPSRESQLRVPSLREKHNDRLSREYTSNVPLPESSHLIQPSQGGLRRVSTNHLPPSSLLRTGDRDRRFAERTAPPVAYESNDRTRTSSAGTQYPASRRSSAGLSLAAGRRPRQSGLAVETGAGE